MKASTVSGHITQLTRAHFVNAFLVREEDGLTLVDTTMGRGDKALLTAAQAVGAPIRRIAVTHGHGDHVGSLDALKARLGDAVEVLVPEIDARILEGDKPEASCPAAGPRSRRSRTRGSPPATGSAASR